MKFTIEKGRSLIKCDNWHQFGLLLHFLVSKQAIVIPGTEERTVSTSLRRARLNVRQILEAVK